MRQSPIIRAYKMTTDSGFAPCVDRGLLTLATCKPGIRKCAKKGEWVAGFSSNLLAKKSHTKPGQLIYLMQITGEMTFAQYLERYPGRRDCIWKKGSCGNLVYQDNQDHNEVHWGKDSETDRILLSDMFYYFGRKPLELSPDQIHIPSGPTRYGVITEGIAAQKFIDAVEKAASSIYGGKGKLNKPHSGAAKCCEKKSSPPYRCI